MSTNFTFFAENIIIIYALRFEIESKVIVV